MTKGTPKPGSDAALARGCRCPVLDNAHGRGAWGSDSLFWIAQNCPLHGTNSPKKRKQTVAKSKKLKDPEPEKNPVLKELIQWAERLDRRTKGDEVCHALDEVVIDTKLVEASEINNQGYDAQLAYLVECDATDDARLALTALGKELDQNQDQ
jgi:hypothetical protein